MLSDDIDDKTEKEQKDKQLKEGRKNKNPEALTKNIQKYSRKNE